jgi:hypothetical protein
MAWSAMALGLAALFLGLTSTAAEAAPSGPINPADAPGANHPSTSVTDKTVYVGVDGPVRNSVASRQ